MSKLLADTFREPRGDAFVALGVFDAPAAVQPPAASYLAEAHRLVREQLDRRDASVVAAAVSLQDGLREQAAATVRDFARLREQLRDLFGRAVVGGGTDGTAGEADDDLERRARRECVACEVFVGAYARLAAKERRSEQVRRRTRDDGGGSGGNGNASLLELSLDLPCGFLSHGLPAATQQEQRRETQSRRALLATQAQRRDMQQHVVGTALPSIAAQTEQLRDDLTRVQRALHRGASA